MLGRGWRRRTCRWPSPSNQARGGSAGRAVAIRRALAIDPGNAEAQSARGQVLWTPVKGFQNRAALHALGAALRLNPGCHQARIWQCLVFLHLGLLKEAREGLLEALATNPDDARTLVFIGQVALYAGNYKEADEYHERALAIDPANIWANLFFPIVGLSSNRLERAQEQLRAAFQVLPSEPTLKSVEALIWAKRGEKRKAEQLIRRALTGGKPVLHTHQMIHNAAAVYGVLGKPAQAITLSRKAIATGLPNYPLFRDDPNLQPLHNQPAFARMMGDLKETVRRLPQRIRAVLTGCGPAANCLPDLRPESSSRHADLAITALSRACARSMEPETWSGGLRRF